MKGSGRKLAKCEKHKSLFWWYFLKWQKEKSWFLRKKGKKRKVGKPLPSIMLLAKAYWIPFHGPFLCEKISKQLSWYQRSNLKSFKGSMSKFTSHAVLSLFVCSYTVVYYHLGAVWEPWNYWSQWRGSEVRLDGRDWAVYTVRKSKWLAVGYSPLFCLWRVSSS